MNFGAYPGSCAMAPSDGLAEAVNGPIGCCSPDETGELQGAGDKYARLVDKAKEDRKSEQYW